MTAVEPGPAYATADHAESFLQRRALWSRLGALFAARPLTEAQLDRVIIAAELAFDAVASDYHLSPEERASTHTLLRDYAICASLYGFASGLLEQPT